MAKANHENGPTIASVRAPIHMEAPDPPLLDELEDLADAAAPIAESMGDEHGDAGQERHLRVEPKNKELRIICHCHQALLSSGESTWTELVSAVNEFREMHRAHLSAMPRPGELPFRAHLTPSAVQE